MLIQLTLGTFAYFLTHTQLLSAIIITEHEGLLRSSLSESNEVNRNTNFNSGVGHPFAGLRNEDALGKKR